MLGSVGVALLTLLDNFFPPVPSEVVLPMAGYLASQGRLTLVGALMAATVGSVLGAIILYSIGVKLGRSRVDRLITRIPLVQLDDLDRARAWFYRHGTGAVFFGRMVPGVRSLISIPAGIQQMPMVRFMVATTLGSLLWNIVLVGAGYVLGRQWRSVAEYSDVLNYVLIGALVLAVARFVWRRRDRLRHS